MYSSGKLFINFFLLTNFNTSFSYPTLFWYFTSLFLLLILYYCILILLLIIDTESQILMYKTTPHFWHGFLSIKRGSYTRDFTVYSERNVSWQTLPANRHRTTARSHRTASIPCNIAHLKWRMILNFSCTVFQSTKSDITASVHTNLSQKLWDDLVWISWQWKRLSGLNQNFLQHIHVLTFTTDDPLFFANTQVSTESGRKTGSPKWNCAAALLLYSMALIVLSFDLHLMPSV